MNPAAESLWFLSPGLSHLLGNAVFAIQGRAQLLAADPSAAGAGPGLDAAGSASSVGGVAADAEAILAGVERARGALSVMRWLRDEVDEGEVADAHAVLAAVGEVARLPLRDRGYRLTWAEGGGVPLWVPPGAFCRLVVAACRSLTEPVGPALGGELRLTLAAAPDTCLRLEVERNARAGVLPFGVESAAIERELGPELAALQGLVMDDRGGDQVALVMPQARQA